MLEVKLFRGCLLCFPLCITLTIAGFLVWMELVSHSARAEIATNIIVTIMITHWLSIHCAQALIDICQKTPEMSLNTKTG